ncbi:MULTISPECIES: hypothetical protein [unclassified Candidatus Tisiphia]|uniref:hypothetical protein n=1 Tax=unclassified Candidatus Tisiphia TaxID=2996318 RepID=UPI0035C93127
MVLSLNKVSIVSTRIQTVEEIIPTLMNSQGDVYPSISGLYIPTSVLLCQKMADRTGNDKISRHNKLFVRI